MNIIFKKHYIQVNSPKSIINLKIIFQIIEIKLDPI